MATEDNKPLIRRWIEARNRHDVEAAVSLFGADWQDRVRTSFNSTTTALPDVRITIEDMIAEGPWVVLRWSYRGTHGGTYRGFAATGAVIDWKGIDIYTVRDGRIVEVVREADNLSLLQQLGAQVSVPEPAPA